MTAVPPDQWWPKTHFQLHEVVPKLLTAGIADAPGAKWDIRDAGTTTSISQHPGTLPGQVATSSRGNPVV